MTLQRSLLLVVAGIAAVLAVVVVLEGPGPRVGEPDRDGRLDVELAIRSFEPDHLYLPTGRALELTFVNHSDVQHVFAFGRQPTEEGGRVTGEGEDLFAGIDLAVEPSGVRQSPSESHPFTEFRLDVGQTMTMRFELPADRAGEWELGCFTAAGCYYETGFRADVTVE